MGRLSTHVLDTAHGCPAGGLRIELFALSPGRPAKSIGVFTTNADGRTDTPLLQGEGFGLGTFELNFHIGDYFRKRGVALPDPPFLDIVPIRFGIADLAGHYHVPLLCSPYAYSTYRGS